MLAPLLSISLVACQPDEILEADISCGQESHIHAVDLGLSVKWACCNIGANSPEDYGNYYAWGEITTKEVYSSETYTYTSSPTRLSLSVDAANVNWGGKWRMPTYDEVSELL